jgi:hypothetical protein
MLNEGRGIARTACGAGRDRTALGPSGSRPEIRAKIDMQLHPRLKNSFSRYIFTIKNSIHALSVQHISGAATTGVDRA